MCVYNFVFHKIFLRAFADNQAAIRSYEKAGFVQEGYFKDEVRIDGRFRDLVFMAVLNPDTHRKEG